MVFLVSRKLSDEWFWRPFDHRKLSWQKEPFFPIPEAFDHNSGVMTEFDIFADQIPASILEIQV